MFLGCRARLNTPVSTIYVVALLTRKEGRLAVAIDCKASFLAHGGPYAASDSSVAVAAVAAGQAANSRRVLPGGGVLNAAASLNAQP